MVNLLTSVKTIIYRVGIYIRLSKEDEEKKKKEKGNENDSYSVQNQRIFLENYVKELGYELVEIYIDDGYTGTNFNRPSFQRMINDIENGKINMVITKDLSRLGRDYIETGKYVEKYFPSKNVRYISVLDNIDTFYDSANNDIAPFKAVINDMSSRESSKKIRNALRTLQKEGKWVGSCPPLGYMPDPKDNNHLIPNETEAQIVKKIFSLAKNGKNYYQIKEILNEEKVPTASMLRKMHSNTPMANSGIWCSKTVKTILSNELYLGDMVQNKRSRINYKVRKIVQNNKSDWIIVKDTHEPLIDRETFDTVQQILSNCKVRAKKDTYRLLDGLLYCKECKHKISICKPRKSDNKTYIVCNTYRMYSKLKLCTPHSCNYDALEELILSKIRSIFNEFLNKDKMSEQARQICYKELSKNDYSMQIEIYEKQIKAKRDFFDKMYFDFLEEKIDEEMYNRVKQKLSEEIIILEERLSDLKLKLNNLKKLELINLDYSNLVNEFLKLKFSERSLILKLINKIEIGADKQLYIKFNFRKNENVQTF